MIRNTCLSAVRFFSGLQIPAEREHLGTLRMVFGCEHRAQVTKHQPLGQGGGEVIIPALRWSPSIASPSLERRTLENDKSTTAPDR